MEDRDKLIDAFQKEGPGELVHPYWGSLTVSVHGDVSISETTAEGGMARISVNVVESGFRYPVLYSVDTKSEVDTGADDAVTAMADKFEEDLDTTNVIEEVVDAAQTAIDSGYSALRGAKGNVNATLNLVDDVLTNIDNAVDVLDDIMGSPSDIVTSINNLVNEVFVSISTLDDSTQDLIALGEDQNLPYSEGPASQKFRSTVLLTTLETMVGFTADNATVLGSGTQSTAASINLNAIIKIFVSASVVEAARTASELTYDSFDRAFEVLETIGDELETLSLNTTDDEEYRTLVDLKSKLALHIQSTAASLPRIVKYTPQEPIPALVLSQDLYGDPTRADDIIARNGIRNPAIVDGGVEIEVLSK
jgi:prophage DNA circulation protein